MCEESKTPLQKIVSGLTASGFSGVAKASPGIAVTGAGILGISIETWVSILTCCYLLFMLVGALPKVIESIRYLYRLAVPAKPALSVNETPCPDVSQKLKKAQK